MAKPQKSGSFSEYHETQFYLILKKDVILSIYFIHRFSRYSVKKIVDAGYLTKKITDVAQDVIIKEKDCGTP